MDREWINTLKMHFLFVGQNLFAILHMQRLTLRTIWLQNGAYDQMTCFSCLHTKNPNNPVTDLGVNILTV